MEVQRFIQSTVQSTSLITAGNILAKVHGTDLPHIPRDVVLLALLYFIIQRVIAYIPNRIGVYGMVHNVLLNVITIVRVCISAFISIWLVPQMTFSLTTAVSLLLLLIGYALFDQLIQLYTR